MNIKKRENEVLKLRFPEKETIMLKISKKLSVYISLALAVIGFAGLIFLVFYMPTFTEYLIGLPDNTGDRDTLTILERTLIHVFAYCILITATTGDILLFFLLRQVQKGTVFTPGAVALVRGVSWCLIFMGLFFILLCCWFTLFIYMGFAVLFVGLCVRVVKNVIEEAVSIKEENDFTV